MSDSSCVVVNMLSGVKTVLELIVQVCIVRILCKENVHVFRQVCILFMSTHQCLCTNIYDV